MDDPTEVELKLEFAPSDRDRLITSPLLGGDGKPTKLSAIYFDTPAFDLRRAGFTLRTRSDGSKRLQTVKSADGASLLSRNEWERPIDGDEPVLDESAGPLRQHIPDDRLRKLAPLFTTNVERITLPIELPGATRVECAIDSGDVSAGEHRSPISEIEIELIEGSPQGLFDFARLIDAQVPLRLGVQSKSARGYALLEDKAGAAVKADPVRLAPEMTAAAAFAAIAVNCIGQYRRNEMLLLLDQGGAETIHQARVAIRRLRSALALFAPLFVGDRRADHLKAELRWLAGEFGTVRDLDVLLPKFEGDDRDALARARTEHFVHLLGLIELARVRLLPIDIVEWLEVGAWRMAPADPSTRDIDIASFASTHLDRMRRRIRRRGRDLGKLADEQRHEVRKDAKKLRYAAEFFVMLYPGRRARRRLDGILGHLETLQDALGRLNDDASVGELLARHAIDARLPALREKKRRKLIKKAEHGFDDLIDCKRFWHG